MYVSMYSVYKVDYRGAAAPKNGQRYPSFLSRASVYKQTTLESKEVEILYIKTG